MITTKGRYALRILIDIAENQESGYVSLKSIAERQKLSTKYLEHIVSVLIKDGMLDATPGKGGGYKLKYLPEEYNIGQILRLTEGDLITVNCLSDEDSCSHTAECKTHPLWKKYQEITDQFFNDITLADLLEGGRFATDNGQSS